MWNLPLLALLSGALSTAAFEPFGYWWLLPLTLGYLFYQWANSTPAKSAMLGFLFGLGLFSSGVSWVYVSLKVYGNMPMPMAIVAVALFVSLLSLYFALAGFVQAKIPVRPAVRLMLLIPAIWVLAETLRSLLFTGFPWLLIGYSQTNGPMAGFAPLGGVLLVSLMVAVMAGAVALLCQDRQRATLLVSVVIGMLLISAVAEKMNWTRPAGEPLLTAAVQGNINLATKWRTDYRAKSLDTYVELSSRTDANLVVWPETAAAYYIHEFDSNDWARLTRPNRTLVFGALESVTADNSTLYYNSAVLVCNQSRQIYRKQHLVPFGEYLPLSNWLEWLLEYLHIPMSDFSAWEAPQHLQCPPLSLAVSICYEDAFEEAFRQQAADKHLLINLSEDAWFGDSLAPHQRLQIAQMRVLENAKPMVRAGNTGPSAIIDHDGEILAISDQFSEAVIEATVQPRSGQTFFARTGNLPLITLLLLLVAAAPLLRLSRKH